MKSKDDVINLILADRIKQDLPNHCLRHVLAIESDSWLTPDRLVNVVDVYMNSHVAMSEYGASMSQKASSKSSGTCIFSRGKAVQVESSVPTNVSQRPVGRCKIPTCWTCGEVGHTKDFHRPQIGKSSGGNSFNAQKANPTKPKNVQISRAALVSLPAEEVKVDCADDVTATNVNSDKLNVENNVILDELEHVSVEVKGLAVSLDAINDSGAEMSLIKEVC